MRNQFIPVGLLNSPSHPGKKAGLVLEHPGNSILYHLFDIPAARISHLLETGFNVGWEMDFHALKIRERDP